MEIVIIIALIILLTLSFIVLATSLVDLHITSRTGKKKEPWSFKYKIGDKVRIRTREEMEKDFKVERNGDILTLNIGPYVYAFSREMDPLCGQVMTITFVDKQNNCYYMLEDKNQYQFTEGMLEPVESNNTEE